MRKYHKKRVKFDAILKHRFYDPIYGRVLFALCFKKNKFVYIF